MCGAILEPIKDQVVLEEELLDGMPNTDVAFVIASTMMVVVARSCRRGDRRRMSWCLFSVEVASERLP